MITDSSRNRQIIADAPTKVTQFLQRAADRGLTIAKMLDTDNAWVISSPNPIDDWQLWLYYQDTARGRLNIIRYTPSAKRFTTQKMTHARAVDTITDMGDGLARHLARENNRILTDLGTKATPVATTDVNQVVSGLRANGRFALRAARHGHIQRNTPTKVRAALVNRGLVQAAGGILTDLGRAARQHLVGA